MAEALRAAWRLQLASEPVHEAVCVLLAQWALETEEGAEMWCFNIGNLKAPWGAAGPDFCAFPTFEYRGEPPVRVDIAPPDPGCNFRAFPSLEAGVGNFLRGMWEHWTQAWPSVVAGDPFGFAAGLKRQGYYTAPMAQYAAGVRHYFERYLRELPRVDVPPAPDTFPTPLLIAPDVTPT